MISRFELYGLLSDPYNYVRSCHPLERVPADVFRVGRNIEGDIDAVTDWPPVWDEAAYDYLERLFDD